MKPVIVHYSSDISIHTKRNIQLNINKSQNKLNAYTYQNEPFDRPLPRPKMPSQQRSLQS